MTKSHGHNVARPLIASFDGSGQLRSFLHRVAGRRISKEITRRKRICSSSLDAMPLEPAGMTPAMSSPDHVETVLANAFSELDDREVLMVRLTYQEYKLEDIARIVGRDKGQVSRLRKAAYAKLQKRLSEFADDSSSLHDSIRDLLVAPVSEVQP